MDLTTVVRDLDRLFASQADFSKRYYEARKKFAQARYNLTLLLIPKQEDKDYRKASFEKQLLMLLGETPENHKKEVHEYYKDFVTYEQEYKGLEVLVESISSRISSLQSLMKWVREND